ncbi:monodehydroascorbate reductase 6 [Actinidia rufa]|uniref:Monodehydroascorbate reductase 6 n=1 Tax=Actinidia rufa TaxID=165716 RepID=A0A7J0H143_9ERIC|nr:monodehydroascorbate reductase 6 [Actinidia rufa]
MSSVGRLMASISNSLSLKHGLSMCRPQSASLNRIHHQILSRSFRRSFVVAAAAYANENREFVIVGGGNAAGYAARTFVEHGMANGKLCIVTKEEHAPYERPALTKAYLFPTDKKPARLPGFHTCVGSGGERQTPEWYNEQGIEVLYKDPVTGIDIEKQTLTTNLGKLLKYGSLIIATGCTASRTRHQQASKIFDTNNNIYRKPLLAQKEKEKPLGPNIKSSSIMGASLREAYHGPPDARHGDASTRLQSASVSCVGAACVWPTLLSCSESKSWPVTSGMRARFCQGVHCCYHIHDEGVMTFKGGDDVLGGQKYISWASALLVSKARHSEAIACWLDFSWANTFLEGKLGTGKRLLSDERHLEHGASSCVRGLDTTAVTEDVTRIGGGECHGPPDGVTPDGRHKARVCINEAAEVRGKF